VIKSLLLVLVLVASGSSRAAIYDAVVTGMTKTGAQYAIKSPSATVSAGAVVTTAAAKVGSGTATVSGGGVSIAGGVASMPVVAQLASGAASVALTAVRLNPAGLMTSLVVSWLVQEGLQYANENWNKTIESGSEVAPQSFGVYGASSVSCAGLTTALACAQKAMLQIYGFSSSWLVQGPTYNSSIQTMRHGMSKNGPSTAVTHNIDIVYNCATGSARQNGICIATTGTFTRPATEDDFTTAGSHPLPDGAAGELIDNVPLPVNTPTFANPSPVDLDSAPYLDPVSGRQVIDRTTVTPSPTAENPLAVRVERYVVDAGDVPGQTAAPPMATKEASISNQPLNIEFPSDYARQGEAASAAQSISSTLGPKLDKLVETSPAPADPTVPDPSGYTDFGTTFQSLLGWQLPGHTSQCPTASFTAPWNTAYTIDSHCQLVTNHWSALQAAMMVVWSMIALFIVLRA